MATYYFALYPIFRTSIIPMFPWRKEKEKLFPYVEVPIVLMGSLEVQEHLGLVASSVPPSREPT